MDGSAGNKKEQQGKVSEVSVRELPQVQHTGNAFDWRGKPSIFAGTRWKTERQVLLDATRVNAESTLANFVDYARTQKISKAQI